MGQKIKPIGLRVGINRTWDSRWYAGRNYGELLHQDIELRSYLMDRLKQAAISRVVIERPAGRARVTIHAGRPGLIIGKKGQDIERLRADLSKKVGSEVSLNIVEVRKPEIDAKLIAENIAQQLERRVGFRRHEARRPVGHAPRRTGRPDQLRRPSWRCRDRPYRMVPRRPCAASHPACRG
jgi:small subunit ribosomal protein S3